MPFNIEIKAKLPTPGGLEELEKIAAPLKMDKDHTYPDFHIHQIDTFFNVPNGRMKLRTETNKDMFYPSKEKSVLVTYFRSDSSETGPKPSEYILYPTDDRDKLLASLKMGLGVKGVVEKERKVYLLKWDKDETLIARVHLDKVQGLGEYLEFEVVLSNDSPEQLKSGHEFAEELMEKFGIKRDQLVTGAYMDALLSATN